MSGRAGAVPVAAVTIHLQNSTQRSLNGDGKGSNAALNFNTVFLLKQQRRCVFTCASVSLTGENVSAYSGVQPSFLRHQGGARTPHPGPSQVLHLIKFDQQHQHIRIVSKNYLRCFLRYYLIEYNKNNSGLPLDLRG